MWQRILLPETDKFYHNVDESSGAFINEYPTSPEFSPKVYRRRFYINLDNVDINDPPEMMWPRIYLTVSLIPEKMRFYEWQGFSISVSYKADPEGWFGACELPVELVPEMIEMLQECHSKLLGVNRG